MSSFDFDANKTSEENIDAFLVHLRTVSPQLAKVFESHLRDIFPLPEGQARTRARQKFNEHVAKDLVAISLDSIESP